MIGDSFYILEYMIFDWNYFRFCLLHFQQPIPKSIHWEIGIYYKFTKTLTQRTGLKSIYRILFAILKRFIYNYVYVSVYINAGGPEPRKRVLDSLELELQVTINCPTRVLGTLLRSSARVASDLNNWANSPALYIEFWIGVSLEAFNFLWND